MNSNFESQLLSKIEQLNTRIYSLEQEVKESHFSIKQNPAKTFLMLMGMFFFLLAVAHW